MFFFFFFFFKQFLEEKPRIGDTVTLSFTQARAKVGHLTVTERTGVEPEEMPIPKAPEEPKKKVTRKSKKKETEEGEKKEPKKASKTKTSNSKKADVVEEAVKKELGKFEFTNAGVGGLELSGQMLARMVIAEELLALDDMVYVDAKSMDGLLRHSLVLYLKSNEYPDDKAKEQTQKTINRTPMKEAVRKALDLWMRERDIDTSDRPQPRYSSASA